MNKTDTTQCAHIVLQVVPQVMQLIRSEVRSGRDAELSVLQLRALAYLYRRPGAPLSALAEHVGLTLPSMSSQVSGLVGRGLIDRSVSELDRRYVTLTLTSEGEAVFRAAYLHAEGRVAHVLQSLSETERATVVAAMEILARVFQPADTTTVPEASRSSQPSPDHAGTVTPT